MYKRRILVLCVCLSALCAESQQINPPQIQWQRSFGGSGQDSAYCVKQTSDGGFIVGGQSSSGVDGNKTSPNLGSWDYWVVRLDRDGNKLWERCFGGDRMDGLSSLAQTTDGGFVLAGHSDSSNSVGNKTAPAFGFFDFWIIRLDADGNKIWDKSFGGTRSDGALSIEQTPNGGFLIGGSSNSGGEANTNNGTLFSDLWLICLDPQGNKVWDRLIGGDLSDDGGILQRTTDGGLILGGDSKSTPSRDKSSSNFGSWDFWVVRLDASGNKIWDKSFGGSALENLRSVQQIADGGFILGGRSPSGLGGNKMSPNFGGNDYWVVRLDAEGDKLWEHSFGGTGGDLFGQVCQTADGGFILAGGSQSGANGNKTSLGFGNQDIWLVRLDAQGNKLWEQAYGGSEPDGLISVQVTSDGGFILGGTSYSPADGNKTTPAFGGEDFWIIKLGPEPPSLRLLPQSFADIGSSGYRFVLAGLSNQTCVLEHSVAMLAWTPFQTNLITGGMVEIIDAAASNSAVRFYRARLVE